jgi:hypothetical protein
MGALPSRHAVDRGRNAVACWAATVLLVARRRCTRPYPNSIASQQPLLVCTAVLSWPGAAFAKSGGAQLSTSNVSPRPPCISRHTKHHVLRTCCRRLNNSCGALSPLPAGHRYCRSAAQELTSPSGARVWLHANPVPLRVRRPSALATPGRMCPLLSSPLAGSQQSGSSPACPACYWPVLGSVSWTRVRGPGGNSAPGCSRLQRRERPSSLKIRPCQSSCRTASHQLAAPVAVA